MKRTTRVQIAVLGGVLGLCLIAGIVSALSNRGLLAEYSLTGTAPASPERLDDLDKARLVEALHLKHALGDQVWPGWGRADIPVILWTAGVEFLTGVPQPAAPPDEAGWEVVSGDDILGQPYFRRPADAPQNFAVRVGEEWSASMATKWETDRFMMAMFRDMLPDPLGAVFPYRALILPSEAQMAGVLHETFHAYQATVVPARLAAAERAHRLGERYRDADAAMGEAWAKEVDLLIRALQATSESETRALAGQFLAQRAQRRLAASLAADLADYERHLEWEEGLAKYVEMAIWQRAAQATDYQPLPTMAGDPHFKGYRTFEQRFGQELGSMRRSAGQEGETRFYYTGMAQALLLDRLAPGWQARGFDDGVWLEDLLMEKSSR